MNNTDDTKKTAIVIGATGLVGSHLVHLLLEDDEYKKVNVFVRRPTNIEHPKLREYVVDFDDRDTWRDKVKGDVLFSALGTTLKQAGSKEAQYKVDYTYQYDMAVTAASNGVRDYVLVSAQNADPNSSFFYARIKGELEASTSKLPFRNLIFIRPSLLYGKREHYRKRESLALCIINMFNKLGMLKNMKPIHGKDVAQAMLYAYRMAHGREAFTGTELFAMSAKYKLTEA